MDPFFRATLRLERVEPYADGDDVLERTAEMAYINVTGDTPADAMYQVTSHADALHEWHDEPAPAPVLDEAFRMNTALSDIARAFIAPGVKGREKRAEPAAEAAPMCLLRNDDRTQCTLTARHEGGCDFGAEPFVEVLQEPADVDPKALAREVGERAAAAADRAAQPECPNRPYHGNPFRYCPTCPWVEAPDEQ